MKIIGRIAKFIAIKSITTTAGKIIIAVGIATAMALLRKSCQGDSFHSKKSNNQEKKKRKHVNGG